MNDDVRGSWHYRMDWSTQKEFAEEKNANFKVDNEKMDLCFTDTSGSVFNWDGRTDADGFEAIYFLLCRPMRQVNGLGERLCALSWRESRILQFEREIALAKRIWNCVALCGLWVEPQQHIFTFGDWRLSSGHTCASACLVVA